MLAKALIEQIKSMPSIAEVVFENKLINVSDILNIFKQQNKNKCSFVDSAKALNVWSDQIVEDIEEKIAAKRTPLGQILVKMGAVSLEQVTHALDDFLADADESEDNDTDSNSSSKEKPCYASYCELFNAELESTFTDRLKLNDKGQWNDDDFKIIKENIHRLRSASKLVSAENSENLLGCLEGILDEVPKKKLHETNSDISSKLVSIIFKTSRLVSEIQNLLRSGESDSSAMSNDEIKKEYAELKDAYELLKFDIEMA